VKQKKPFVLKGRKTVLSRYHLCFVLTWFINRCPSTVYMKGFRSSTTLYADNGCGRRTLTRVAIHSLLSLKSATPGRLR